LGGRTPAPNKGFYYGGQAVVEGVMMRGRHEAAVAVRTSDGSVIMHTEELPANLYRNRVARLPFVRGLVVLWEMLILGTRMLLWSANIQAQEELDEELPGAVVGIMLMVSLLFAVGLFFVFPLVLVRVAASSSSLGGHIILKNIVEGVIRLLLLVLYLVVLGRTNNLRRVFQYHGAEHKAINAYEAGARLTPATVQQFSLRHTRCGTAFLLWVMVISILVFSVLGNGPIWWRFASRVVLIPVIAAVSYEFLRFSAAYYHVAIVRWIVTPGLWLQGLTTRQPDDSQVEVAITALEHVLEADGHVDATPAIETVAQPTLS
jgi:uncharacterized protein YqhQ